MTSTRISTSVVKYSLAWVSDAAGAVSGNAVTIPDGTIIGVEFTPDSGATQPTNLYDVTCTDDEGVNVFDDGAGASIGANLSNAAASYRVPFFGGGGAVTYVRQWLHGGSYTLVVAAAGNAKGGTVNIYLYEGVL
jgi:hypothetical protein